MRDPTRLSLCAAAAAAAAAAALSACGAAAAPAAHHSAHRTAGTAVSQAAAVRLATVTLTSGGASTHRTALVSANDRPLYLLTGDSRSHPLCRSAACLAAWPPVTSSVAHPQPGSGVHGKLTVWDHNGLKQLVFAGHPLYTFAGDGPGLANGEGIKSYGGTWWVMNANGRASTLTASGGGGSKDGY